MCCATCCRLAGRHGACRMVRQGIALCNSNIHAPCKSGTDGMALQSWRSFLTRSSIFLETYCSDPILQRARGASSPESLLITELSERALLLERLSERVARGPACTTSRTSSMTSLSLSRTVTSAWLELMLGTTSLPSMGRRMTRRGGPGIAASLPRGRLASRRDASLRCHPDR